MIVKIYNVKKFIATCSLFLLLTSPVFAQNNVSGRVYDSNNEPVIGATVIVKNTTKGTTTDFDGNYSLQNVGEEDVLVFSYLGYDDQEITVGGRSVINVTMSRSTTGRYMSIYCSICCSVSSEKPYKSL